MDKDFIYRFIKRHKLAVISYLSKNNMPGSALVGFAVSKDLEIVFDTVKSSRKYENILRNPCVALVIGWDNETTVQYEGSASELVGKESDYYKEIYYEVYQDGREHAETWPNIVHFKITPNWIRYSDFNDPVVIEEMNLGNRF